MGESRAAPGLRQRRRQAEPDSRPLVIGILALALAAVVLMASVYNALHAPETKSGVSLSGLAPELPQISVRQVNEPTTAASSGQNQPATAGSRTTNAAADDTGETTDRETPLLVPRQVPSRPSISALSAAYPSPLLQAALDEAVKDEGSVSVVIKRLADGATATVNGDDSWYAASLFKLAVLYAVERDIASGALHLDDRLFIRGEDYAEDLGTADWLPISDDGSLSLAEALEAMVTVSDNATAVALQHVLGSSLIDERLADLGLSNTSVNTYDLPTTASDMAILMESIVTGRGISQETSTYARALLQAQTTRSGIPSAVGNAVVGNKTGTWSGATHDVAFVEGPGGLYVIAILTDGSWDWDRVARIGEKMHEAIAKVPAGG